MNFNFEEMIGENKISLNCLDYTYMILGEPKAGKSTLLRNFIEENGGKDKGIFFKFEDGLSALNNVNAYPKQRNKEIESFEEVQGLVEYFVENRDSIPYNIIVVDTVSRAFEIFEKETIRRSNIIDKKKAAEKGQVFKAVNNINEAFSGYARGQKYCAKLFMDEFHRKLKNAGYTLAYISHVKEKSVKEQGTITEDTYQVMTSNMEKAYYQTVVEDIDVVAMITSEKAIKKVGKGKARVTEENRSLRLNGNNYYKAGSRLEGLPDAIPVDAKLFKEALEEAIKKTSGLDGEELVQAQEEQADEKAKVVEEAIATATEKKNIEVVRSEITALVKEMELADKKKISAKLEEAKLPKPTKKNLDAADFGTLEKMLEIIKK